MELSKSYLYIKKMRDRRKAQGVCATCGNSNLFGGRINCEPCVIKLRSYSAKSREKNLASNRLKQRIQARKEREQQAGSDCPPECQICKGTFKVCFDHDHVTGKFRGWLCNRCNIILGHAKDSADLLLKLSDYLKQ